MTVLATPPNLFGLYGKALFTGLTRRGDSLPDTTYELVATYVDAIQLADYDRVCGFRLTDELPATYPHVLTFPLQVKLMTDPGFPFPLVGSVHLANRITQTRPLRVDERFGIRVRVENLRPHPKGRQFDMVSEAFTDVVTSGDRDGTQPQPPRYPHISLERDDRIKSRGGGPVWTDVSTYLRRGGGAGEPGKPDPAPAPEPTAVWRVPDDIGRRYAEVSGDRNPIHLHPLTAKLLGFPRAIAHGMWTKARCLAAFEGRLPDAYTVDVRFKLPVLLPATVGFASRPTEDGWTFDLFDARTAKPHLTGTITAGAA